MKFSVIIQSFLGYYEGAATNRDKKLIRAIDSVLKQTFQDFEIIVVADGCEQTYKIVCEAYQDEKQIDCFLIKKMPLWSGQARNFGITKAKGEYVIYLDIDDYYGLDHLQIISDQLANYDWVFYPDFVMGKDGKATERSCLINQKFQSNTSNVCHKRSLGVAWYGDGYGKDDWALVTQLLRFPNHSQIKTPEYYVMHIPNKIDL